MVPEVQDQRALCTIHAVGGFHGRCATSHVLSNLKAASAMPALLRTDSKAKIGTALSPPDRSSLNQSIDPEHLTYAHCSILLIRSKMLHTTALQYFAQQQALSADHACQRDASMSSVYTGCVMEGCCLILKIKLCHAAQSCSRTN